VKNRRAPPRLRLTPLEVRSGSCESSSGRPAIRARPSAPEGACSTRQYGRRASTLVVLPSSRGSTLGCHEPAVEPELLRHGVVGVDRQDGRGNRFSRRARVACSNSRLPSTSPCRTLLAIQVKRTPGCVLRAAASRPACARWRCDNRTSHPAREKNPRSPPSTTQRRTTASPSSLDSRNQAAAADATGTRPHRSGPPPRRDGEAARRCPRSSEPTTHLRMTARAPKSPATCPGHGHQPYAASQPSQPRAPDEQDYAPARTSRG